jgi:hypothetical protein
LSGCSFCRPGVAAAMSRSIPMKAVPAEMARTDGLSGDFLDDPGGDRGPSTLLRRRQQPLRCGGRVRVDRRDDELLGRDMLLGAGSSGCASTSGAYTAVIDETRGAGERVWGWSYQSLEGHLEQAGSATR